MKTGRKFNEKLFFFNYSSVEMGEEKELRSSRAKSNRNVLMRLSPRGNESVVWEEVRPMEREAAQGFCPGGAGISFWFPGWSIQFSIFFLGDVGERTREGHRSSGS